MRAPLKRIDYCLIGVLMILNITFRYPITPHEIGDDSFFVHGLASSISSLGYISWALHPTSLIGLYPLSYPSGSPVFLSVSSQIAGMSIENTILIYGIALAILGQIVSYILALKFKNDRMFAFLTSFIFSTAPVFIELTRWSASTRNLFLAIFPLLLWAIFWTDKSNKKLIILSILALMLTLTHRLYFLLIIIVMAMLFTKLTYKAGDFCFIKKQMANLPSNKIILISLFILAFSLQFSGLGFYKGIWTDYQTGAFSSSGTLPTLLLNLATNYIGQIGILLVFGIYGILAILRGPNKDFRHILVIYTLIISSTILALGTYIAPFLLPFLSLLIALGIVDLLETDRIEETKVFRFIHNAVSPKKMFCVLIIFILLTSISFSCYMIQRHLYATNELIGDKAWASSESIAGHFLINHGAKTYLSNDPLFKRRVSAINGIPAFDGDDLDLLKFNLINPLDFKIELLSPSSIGIDTDGIYSVTQLPNIYSDQNVIVQNNIYSINSKEVLKKYAISYSVINNNLFEKILDENNKPSRSVWVKSTTDYGIRAYANDQVGIYFLGSYIGNKLG